MSWLFSQALVAEYSAAIRTASHATSKRWSAGWWRNVEGGIG